MIASYSPQQPKDLVIEVPESDATGVHAAFARARAAQADWAGAPAGRAGIRTRDRRRRRG